MPPTTTVARNPVTLALVAMLESVTSKKWGDGKAPTDTTVPYGVVWELPGGDTEGAEWAAPDGDAIFVYQLTCVGERRDQAAALADRARGAMLGRDAAGVLSQAITSAAITAAGLVVQDRQPQGTGGVDREGRVFNASDRYLVVVRGVV